MQVSAPKDPHKTGSARKKDHRERRISRKRIRDVLADYQNGGGFTGWWRGYVYLNGQLVAQYSDGTTYFVHADHLGSTRLLTSLGSAQPSNASFESGSSGWTLFGSSTIVTDSSRAHSGNNFLQLTAGPGSGSGAVMSNYLSVTPGQQVALGGWAYRESGSGGHVGWVVEVDDSNHNGLAWSNTYPWSADNPTWTYESGTLTVPAGGAYVKLYCEIYLPTSNTSARCDDGFVSTGSGASVVASIDYLPFGEATYSGSANTTRLFTGDERDSETGLDHTLFRQYSSSLGRWTSPDPLAGDISDPQSLNRYAYVGNNPLAYVDPLGADAEIITPGAGHPCMYDAYQGVDACGDLCAQGNSSCSEASGGGISFSVGFGLTSDPGPFGEIGGIPPGLQRGGSSPPCDFGGCSGGLPTGAINSFSQYGHTPMPYGQMPCFNGSMCRVWITILGMEGILPAQNCDGPCLSSMGRGALGGAYRIAAPVNNPALIPLWYVASAVPNAAGYGPEIAAAAVRYGYAAWDLGVAGYQAGSIAYTNTMANIATWQLFDPAGFGDAFDILSNMAPGSGLTLTGTGAGAVIGTAISNCLAGGCRKR